MIREASGLAPRISTRSGERTRRKKPRTIPRSARTRMVVAAMISVRAKLRVEVMIGGRTLTPRSGRGHPQGARTPKADSLHGDALREVARLVHVAAEPHGD